MKLWVIIELKELKYLPHSTNPHRESQRDVKMQQNLNQFWQVFLSAD
jgi:hypothetical protein